MAAYSRTFGEFIRDTRLKAGLRLRELARRIEIMPSYMSDIENDRRVPSEGVLKQLARHLSLNFEELAARAGRIGEQAERLVKRSPDAVRLFRAAPNLDKDQLRRLREQAEKMAKEKKK